MATGPAQKIPTTELIGPAGRIVVNTIDVPMYTSKGYRDVTTPVTPSTPPATPATSDEAPPATPPVAPPAQDQTPKTANSGPGKAKAIS